jgi:hypothetical protein
LCFGKKKSGGVTDTMAVACRSIFGDSSLTSSRKLKMTTRRLLLAALAVAACSPEVATSPDLEPTYARGGNGGGEPAVSTGILPVQLGDPKSFGCSSTRAAAINDATQTVVGGSCSGPVTLNPFIWTTAGASVVPDTGDVLDVAADGAVAGRLDFRPFYREPGNAPVYLPMTTGMRWGEVSGVTPDGTFAVGHMSAETSGSGALWKLSAGTWTVEEFSGDLWGVSASGTMVVGSQNQRATVWTNTGMWTPTTLPDGGALDSHATAVNQAGTVVVGERNVPGQRDPSLRVKQHVAWISDGAGNWTLQVLGGLNILEGTAYSVATLLDGSVVAVGDSWEDKAGKGAQLWAVAWRKPVGASAFSAPIRLSPISKGQNAGASDVNSKGEIVGYSNGKLGAVAVMWKLP